MVSVGTMVNYVYSRSCELTVATRPLVQDHQHDDVNLRCSGALRDRAR